MVACPAWLSATPQVHKEREAYVAGAETQATSTRATPILQVYTMIFGRRRILRKALHILCDSHIFTPMEIEFDAEKDEINRFKHRLPLSFGKRVFDDDAYDIITTFREIDGEKRYKAIGQVDGKLYTAVFVMRGAKVRMISVRRSNGGEQKEYDRNPR